MGNEHGIRNSWNGNRALFTVATVLGSSIIAAAVWLGVLHQRVVSLEETSRRQIIRMDNVWVSIGEIRSNSSLTNQKLAVLETNQKEILRRFDRLSGRRNLE